MGGQFIEDPEQAGQGVTARVLVARLDLDPHHQAQPGHQVGVVTVRGPARLLRVVRHHRPFLLAVQRLDRRVDVQNPGHIEQGRGALAQVAVEPAHPFVLGNRQQRPAQRVLADHLVHPQQPRIDPVTANRRDVRVAPVPRQNRQHPGAQHIGLARCVRARVDSGQRSCQPDHSPVRVRNSMKYASCPIGVAALSVSQRTCTRPPAVCTPAHDKSISSRCKRFNFDSPIG
jgi:hypothetical protein